MSDTPKPRNPYIATEEQMALYRKLAREANIAAGVRYDLPRLSREEARKQLTEHLAKQGITPKDRIFSQGILQMRYGDEYEEYLPTIVMGSV